LDFYCPEKEIAIEVDDIHHFDSDSMRYDEERTNFLNHLGIRVIRYTNIEVMREIDKVVEDISRELEKNIIIKTKSNLPPPPPL
jgi:very-short-patch-repair endonuclease